MNNENLKKGVKTQFKSGEQAARNGSKGGKKSAEKRKRKKQLRETLIDILEASYPDKNGDKYTGVQMIAIELFRAACDRKGRNYNRSLDQLLTLTGLNLSEEDRKRVENALLLQAQEIELNKQRIEKNDEWS